MDAFSYPKQFAEILHANNGSYGSFLNYKDVEDGIVPPFLCK